MTHFQEVVGLNPGAIYWMDMTFCTLIYCKNCFVCLKRPKINEKEAKVGPFKNTWYVEAAYTKRLWLSANLQLMSWTNFSKKLYTLIGCHRTIVNQIACIISAELRWNFYDVGAYPPGDQILNVQLLSRSQVKFKSETVANKFLIRCGVSSA